MQELAFIRDKTHKEVLLTRLFWRQYELGHIHIGRYPLQSQLMLGFYTHPRGRDRNGQCLPAIA